MQAGHLVKNFPDVGFGLSKPHGEQLWAFDRDEVGLALIGDGLRQESFTTTRGSVEQHPLRRGHSKLQEFVWMFHGILKGNRITNYFVKMS